MHIRPSVLAAALVMLVASYWSPSVDAQTPSDGIRISRADLRALPMTGASWTQLVSEAEEDCSAPNLADQDDRANVCVMAKALVAARTNDRLLRSQVMAALSRVAGGGPYAGRALALGRELAAYVIAADLIELRSQDAALDARFRTRIRALLTTPTVDGPASLVICHEERPNNWGTHCGASRVAVAAYLGDHAEMARAAAVFKGWLGDRTSYALFEFNGRGWQCDPKLPVPINPVGCVKRGHPIDGVLADDQQRSGGFKWPPPKENYVYEALQGALVQAIILHRAGYDTFAWESRALLRAFEWLDLEANFEATGDDVWEAHVINHYYGSTFPAAASAVPGKNVVGADWTHRGTTVPPAVRGSVPGLPVLVPVPLVPIPILTIPPIVISPP